MITSESEHFMINLLMVRITAFMKCIFKKVDVFFGGVLWPAIYLTELKKISYVLYGSNLSNKYIAKIFSHSGSNFTLTLVPFNEQIC